MWVLASMIVSRFLPVIVLSTAALAIPGDLVEASAKTGKRCTGTINSYASVGAAVACTTIVIRKSVPVSHLYMSSKGNVANFAPEAFTMTQGGEYLIHSLFD